MTTACTCSVRASSEALPGSMPSHAAKGGRPLTLSRWTTECLPA